MVSVIISTYNRPALLDRALASVHAQDYDDFEVVVVDDASPDQEAVRAVLESWDAKFAARGVDLWSYRFKENSGYQCEPKNQGIARSTGEYIAYLDDDNTWRPNHLSALVAAITSDFSHDMVYSRRCLHVDDETLKKIGDPDLKAAQDVPGQEWNPALLGVRNYIDTSEIMHSRGAYYQLIRKQTEIGLNPGWDEGCTRFGDHEFVASWALCGLNAKLVDVVTVDYNLHAGSLQVTRPSMEQPGLSNYANYLRERSQRDPSLQLP